MKKVLLIAATIGITLPALAQDKYVVSANLALKNQNYDEAKSEIDKAMANPETAKKPKALFSKAQVYFQLQNVDKFKNDNPYREGLQAVMDLAAAKPDYEKASVDQMLMLGGFLAYNDGVKAYNAKNYSESVKMMEMVSKVYDMGKSGQHFEKLSPNVHKQLDTVAADADLTMANAVYYSGDMDAAIPLLIKVKNNPIRNSPSVHECLIDAYAKKGNTAQELAAIEEARKEFPNDLTVRNYELNYYIKAGKMDELVKKLEEAAAKEPANADIQFNLATTYLSMASPKDGKKPANAADLYAKSESAFQNAVKIAPDNSGYNYNFGALYFNQATDVNDQINAITGTSKEDMAKYESLKAKRDGLFVKAVPYFEKAYNTLAPQDANLKGEDLKTYKSTLTALNRIYALQNKMDKAQEMKKKLETL